MSKAFTRESDDGPELPNRPRRLVVLPPGTRNYLTASGALRLREELEELLHPDTPAEIDLSDSEGARAVPKAAAERIAQIEQALATAEVVEPPPPPHDQVRFGATVTVRHGNGEETCYRIVGMDETDIDRDWISWLSPLAKALLNTRLGQTIPISLPAGKDELTILGIRYE